MSLRTRTNHLTTGVFTKWQSSTATVSRIHFNINARRWKTTSQVLLILQIIRRRHLMSNWYRSETFFFAVFGSKESELSDVKTFHNWTEFFTGHNLSSNEQIFYWSQLVKQSKLDKIGLLELKYMSKKANIMPSGIMWFMLRHAALSDNPFRFRYFASCNQ